MKKYLLLALSVCFCFLFISWGYVGHKTIGTIAENHLTPNAKTAVKSLLGDQSIADVASWADNVRNQPEYQYTGPWHYLEFTLGMNYEDFSKHVEGMDANNVYGAILKFEAELKSDTTSHAERIVALKFLIHFISDCHQPMHLSKAEDKGGNTVIVQFDGQDTNLHSLWDSKLIDHQGFTFDKMAKEYDTATPEQIKQWQSGSQMKWIFESYQIAGKIYAEVEKNNNKLDEAYYKANIPVVQERIEMAGIRLAGVLNSIFSSPIYNK